MNIFHVENHRQCKRWMDGTGCRKLQAEPTGVTPAELEETAFLQNDSDKQEVKVSDVTLKVMMNEMLYFLPAETNYYYYVYKAAYTGIMFKVNNI